MAGPITILLACRASIVALDTASDVAGGIESACGMWKTLPSSRWRETYQIMRTQLPFWMCLLAIQTMLVGIGVQFALMASDLSSMLERCREGIQCGAALQWARWILQFGTSTSYDPWYGLMIIAFIIPATLSQASWLAAAKYARSPSDTPMLGLRSFISGCAGLPRAAWLGILPMRLLCQAADVGTKVFIMMEWRWRIMVLGRFCHFTILALIARETASKDIPDEAKRCVEVHHKELLDSFGTYNIIFASCIGILLLLIGGLYLTSPDAIANFNSLIVAVAMLLSAPIVSATLLTIAHFSRVINGQIA